MPSPHRLHGVSRPQVFLLGRPREAPINDSIFPLTILGLLELSNEFVEDAGKSFCCCFKFLEGPLGPSGLPELFKLFEAVVNDRHVARNRERDTTKLNQSFSFISRTSSRVKVRSSPFTVKVSLLGAA